MKPLKVTVGSATNTGLKSVNQDYLGYQIPPVPLLPTKGIALAIADGISSSQVSQIASESAIRNFLEDYYHTPEGWSIRGSGEKVIKSINAALYSQSQNGSGRFNKDKGYVCTFSALVLCSHTAHIFHLGDSRIYRMAKGQLELLTQDHRHFVSHQESYLSRALGVQPVVELDYVALPIEQGDVFVMATDGLYEFISAEQLANAIRQSSHLDTTAQNLIELALNAGSDDNLSLHIVRVEQVPHYPPEAAEQNVTLLPLPPPLKERMLFNGYEIIRSIYISSRSHVFLARDLSAEQESEKSENRADNRVVIKVPSQELRDDIGYLENFMLEDWIAKRVNNPHLLKAIDSPRKRDYLYLVSEYIEGQSLAQWMIDNPKPSLEQVRNIVKQIASGLQALHRKAMIHQDIRPANIMIDKNNTVKIIDFGSTHIAGVSHTEGSEVLRGTLRYSAPEYFLGHAGSERSDIFSLGVIAYQMLSGNAFPYRIDITQARSVKAQQRLTYQSLISDETELPVWIDDALHKALHINPLKRYSEVAEFTYDLHHPNQTFINRTRPPLIQRNPVIFWQGVSLLLLLTILWLVVQGS